MKKISFIVIALFSLLMAARAFADWKTFTSPSGNWSANVPCLPTSQVEKSDAQQIRTVYSCKFENSDFSMQETIFTPAGKEFLKKHPYDFLSVTEVAAMDAYKKMGMTVTSKRGASGAYKTSTIDGTAADKSKLRQVLYVGPNGILNFSTAAPEAKMKDRNKMFDSLKILK